MKDFFEFTEELQNILKELKKESTKKIWIPQKKQITI